MRVLRKLDLYMSFILTLALAVIPGCSSPLDSAVVAGVQVTVDSTVLAMGNRAKASVTVKDAAGNPIAGQLVNWASLTPSVATVSDSGLVTAVAAGVVTIQATVFGLTGSARLAVIVPPDLASNNFDNGSWGQYVHFFPADEDIIADPTGAGRGGVARFHYAGSNGDRNRFLQYQHAVKLGQTLYFRGEFYLPLASLGDGSWGRKLLYWQNHQNYIKYNGANLPGMNMLVLLVGNSLVADWTSTRFDGSPPEHQTTIAQDILTNHWYTLEMEITFESAIGAKDGVARVWLDGTPLYQNVAVGWTDPAWVGQLIGGVPYDAADMYLDAFLVGDQVNLNAGSFDEYRYWDNVAFSTKRIGQ